MIIPLFGQFRLCSDGDPAEYSLDLLRFSGDVFIRYLDDSVSDSRDGYVLCWLFHSNTPTNVYSLGCCKNERIYIVMYSPVM